MQRRLEFHVCSWQGLGTHNRCPGGGLLLHAYRTKVDRDTRSGRFEPTEYQKRTYVKRLV